MIFISIQGYRPDVQALLELLIRELERPRPFPPQVIRHLGSSYGVGRDGVGQFLDQQLASLDDAEIDVLLSPVYTPKLRDQAPFAALLGRDSVPKEKWPQLIDRLLARPTVGRVQTEDGEEHSIPLRQVTLERFVHRLRLEGTLPEAIARLITSRARESDRPWLLALGRRAVWDTEARQDILARYLVAVDPSGLHFESDAQALLKLMETSLPTGVAELLKRLPDWEETLRSQLANASAPRPFFNLQVQEMHGGGRDQRRGSAAAAAQHQVELEFLRRLQVALLD